MSQSFDLVLEQLRALSVQERSSLRVLLDHDPATGDRRQPGNVSAFGWAKGQIVIGPDFDEPMDDFKDYID